MQVLIVAWIAGLIIGYVVGVNPDPMTVVTDPIGAFQTAFNTIG